ncbi:anti-sigma F factor [uncultured Ruminococcus sp.]|uniref:anti-sigma F factor n=1 Tax=uncultured Ruminococcus sp. TaxID=165186 RepID=UPI0025D4B285|nr:anti-sigma F factor [uncultured Ruminococcus sp.]
MKRSKQLINEMKLTFPSLSENERFARIAVSGFLSQLDPCVDELSDIKTAVSEGVTNAIVHGYRGRIGNVLLQVKIFEGGYISIKIQDKGCGIENIEKAREPLFTTAPEDDRAGLGFSIMESFMENVKVRSQKDKGTTVILERRVRSRKQLL